MPMGWAPLGWRPFSMLVDMTLAATIAVPQAGVTLNYTAQIYASVDTVYTAVIPFVTLSADTLPLQQFTGRLKKGLEFHVSIADGEDIGRKMSTGVGELQLENSDGGYDSLYRSNTIDGRRVLLKYGQYTLATEQPASFDAYVTLLDGTAQDWFLDSSELRITLRDNTFKLDVPASANAYGGTGTTDGDAGLAGKRKPLAFGVANNVTPVLINAANLVYQVHGGGAVNAIPAVYDSGYALPTPATAGPDADYASYAALIAATISNGHYATCKAQALFRLGATPFGTLTCDVQGDSGGTGGYVTDTAAIVRRLIALSATQVDLVDEGSFLALSAAQPAVVGYYLGLDENKTVRQAADDLLGGIGASGGFRRDGVFEVIRFVAPTGTAVDSYTADDIVDDTLHRAELPSAYNPPPKRQRVAYAHNWTVQTDVSAGVSDTRKQVLKDEFSVASHSNTSLATSVSAAHLLAQDPDPIPGYFNASADAVAEADRQLSLKAFSPSLYTFTLKGKGLTRKIGDVISLTYPRFDLSGGKRGVIVGRVDNTSDGTVEITAWTTGYAMPLWSAARAAVLAGTRNAKVLCIGDSTTAGYGANGSGSDGAEPFAYPARLASLLSDSFTASRQSWFGDHNMGGAGLQLYDTRLSMTSGWAPVAINSIGKDLLQNTTNTTGVVNFTPTIPVDTFEVYTTGAPGTDDISIAVDGGAVIATAAGNLGAIAYVKTTVSAGSLGSHTVNLKRVVTGGGGAYIAGVIAYNSAAKQIEIINGGWSSSKASDWNDSTYAFSPLPAIAAQAPDLTIFCLGINEYLNGVTPATFTANMQPLITAAKISGDVLIMTPPPTDPVTWPVATVAVQNAMVDAMKALAFTNRCNVVDIVGQWGSYANGQSLGLYYDALHPSQSGYLELARSAFAYLRDG